MAFSSQSRATFPLSVAFVRFCPGFSEYVTERPPRRPTVFASDANPFFPEIFPKSPWKPANDSQLANVAGANISW